MSEDITREYKKRPGSNPPYDIDPVCPFPFDPADIVGQRPAEQGLMCDNGLHPSQNPDNYLPPHNGGFNILFLDGHAKWYPVGQLGTIHPPLIQLH